MPRLTFRSTEILSVTLRGETNAFMASIQMRATLTKPIAEEMGWDRLLVEGGAFKDGWTTITPVCSIGSGTLTMTPNGGDQALAIKFDKVINFVAVREEPESDNTKKPKLSVIFKVMTSADNAEALLGKYWRKNQEKASVLVVVTEQLNLGEADQVPAAEGAAKATASLQ